MLEYKFIKIDLKGFLVFEPKQDYQAIINEHAKEGWRLVQIFAPPVGSQGLAHYFEIILERTDISL